LVVAVGVPTLSTAFLELVWLGGDSPPAAKAATMITELSLGAVGLFHLTPSRSFMV
jgi:hypothetical protein